MPNNEQTEFLKEFDPKPTTDVLEAPLIPESEKVEDTEEDDSEKATNRRERRLQTKLQAERESSIALAAKLEVLTEAQKFSRETNPEIDETITRIYGTNTPEAAEATALLSKAFKNVEERAKDSALQAFRDEQAQERNAVAQEEQTLDSMIEDIEDETGLTLDPNTQKTFFSLLEKLSPKDSEGNVIAYADHHAVWEELQARRQPQQNRAKDLASRSMVKTGASPSTSVEQDATERYLRENGLI